MTEENEIDVETEEEMVEEAPSWLRGMRMLVLAAGLLLLGGVLLFSGVFFTKAKNYSQHMDAQLGGENASERGLCETYAPNLSLNNRGTVVGIQLSATLAHATLQLESGELILLTVDRCSGDIITQQGLQVNEQAKLNPAAALENEADVSPEAVDPSAPSQLPWHSESE